MKLTNIHKKLAVIRKERGIKQSEVAKWLKVDVSTVSLYESGGRGIPFPTLENWLQLFDVRIDFLIEQEETDEDPRLKAMKPIKASHDFQKLKKQRNQLIIQLNKMVVKALVEIFKREDGRYTIVPDNEKDGGLSVGLIEERSIDPFDERVVVHYNDISTYLYVKEVYERKEKFCRIPFFTEQDFLQDFYQKREPNSIHFVELLEYRPGADRYYVEEAVGFSLDSLISIKETHQQYYKAIEEVFMTDLYQTTLDELNNIKRRLNEILDEYSDLIGNPFYSFDLWYEGELFKLNESIITKCIY